MSSAAAGDAYRCFITWCSLPLEHTGIVAVVVYACDRGKSEITQCRCRIDGDTTLTVPSGICEEDLEIVSLCSLGLAQRIEY